MLGVGRSAVVEVRAGPELFVPDVGGRGVCDVCGGWLSGGVL